MNDEEIVIPRGFFCLCDFNRWNLIGSVKQSNFKAKAKCGNFIIIKTKGNISFSKFEYEILNVISMDTDKHSLINEMLFLLN